MKKDSMYFIFEKGGVHAGREGGEVEGMGAFKNLKVNQNFILIRILPPLLKLVNGGVYSLCGKPPSPR